LGYIFSSLLGLASGSTSISRGDGTTVFAHACKLGLEGIVSKRRDSSYRSGRSPDWLKMKNPYAPGRETRRGGRMGQKETAMTAIIPLSLNLD
jgi:hypothetical protein